MKICRQIAAGSKYLVLILFFMSASAHAQTNCAADRFLFQEARKLYSNNQKLLSAVHFSTLRTSSCAKEIQSKSWLGYAMALYDLGEKSESLSVIEDALKTANVLDSEKASLRMLKTWILESPVADLTPSQKQNWEKWETRFQSSNEIKNSPRKSPWVSGIASAVLPGSGQAINGNWQTAALAFAINAIFLGATLEFADNDLHAAALASGVVFSITYVGNIVSAAQGANEWNKLSRQGAEKNLKSRLFPELSY